MAYVEGTARAVKFPQKATATQRAVEAARLMRAGKSARQARRATGCSVGYQHTASKLSDAELDLVDCGVLRLAQFHTSLPIGDQEIDRWIARVGYDRVWAGLERLTRPTTLIAAE